MSPPTRRAGPAEAVRGGALGALFAALAVFAAGAVPLAGQERAAPAAVPVSGQVTDRSTGQPLPGALVEVEGSHQRALTDAEGRFGFRRVRPGEHTLYVSLLGYGDLERAVRVGEAGSSLALALEPDPVLLEGLTVKMNVLEQRRRRTTVASRAFDRRQIRSSAAPHVEAFLRGPGGVATSSCRVAFADSCVWSRGRLVPVAVYLDEMPIYSMDHLASLQPEEVERIEVYQNGRQVRVYTSWFMEQVARGKRWVDPVFLR